MRSGGAPRDAALAHEPRQERRVESAGHVVAGRDRQEGAGVVDEARAAVEAGGLGDGRAEPQHRIGGVEEPPRRADEDARVEPGERRDLARVDRLVDGEQDEVQAAARGRSARAAGAGCAVYVVATGMSWPVSGPSRSKVALSGCGSTPGWIVMTSPSSYAHARHLEAACCPRTRARRRRRGPPATARRKSAAASSSVEVDGVGLAHAVVGRDRAVRDEVRSTRLERGEVTGEVVGRGAVASVSRSTRSREVRRSRVEVRVGPERRQHAAREGRVGGERARARRGRPSGRPWSRAPRCRSVRTARAGGRRARRGAA